LNPSSFVVLTKLYEIGLRKKKVLHIKE